VLRVQGRFPKDVNGAIVKARTAGKTAADVRVVAKEGKVSIDVGSGQGAAKVYLVGYDRKHVTAIGRGENRGRTMPESNIVRSFRSVADWRRSMSNSRFRTERKSPSFWRLPTATSSEPRGLPDWALRDGRAQRPASLRTTCRSRRSGLCRLDHALCWRPRG
jgi:hypothetical protein